jgi:hypothetical protein
MKKDFRYGEPIEYKMSKKAAEYYLGDRKGDDKTQNDLSYKFGFFAQTVFVVFENLDIVIRKAQTAQPKHGENQQLDVGVGQVAEKQDAGQ